MGVVSNHVTKRPVQDVGTGVVLADPLPPLPIEIELYILTRLNVPGRDPPPVTMQAGKGVAGVRNDDLTGGGCDRAAVTDLTPGLRVEGRPVEEHFDLLAFVGPFDRLTVTDDGKDPAHPLLMQIAGEFGRFETTQE